MFDQRRKKNSQSNNNNSKSYLLKSALKTNKRFTERKEYAKSLNTYTKKLIKVALGESNGHFSTKPFPVKHYGKSGEREKRSDEVNNEAEDRLRELILTAFEQNSAKSNQESHREKLSSTVVDDLFPRDSYLVRYNDPMNSKPNNSKDNLSNDYQPNSSIQETIYEPTDIYGEPSYFNDNNLDDIY